MRDSGQVLLRQGHLQELRHLNSTLGDKDLNKEKVNQGSLEEAKASVSLDKNPDGSDVTQSFEHQDKE